MEAINDKPSELARDPRKDLSFKAGFVSLQERLGQWVRRSPSRASDEQEAPSSFVGSFKKEHHPTETSTGQFATLHEFFQSKTSFKKQLELDELARQQRRPKMPIMKLSKEDWNVKCWEDRFKPLSLRQRREVNQMNSIKHTKNNNNNKENSDGKEFSTNNKRELQPEIRTEVFHGRIEEVSKKLDKVREGQPQDEKLFKLSQNKLLDGGRKLDHSWTDFLKQELSSGAHNSKAIKSDLLDKIGARQSVVKSPLGRPIGKICRDDDD